MSTHNEQAEVNTLHDDLAAAFEQSNEPEYEEIEEQVEEVQEFEPLTPPEFFRKEHKTLFEKMAEIDGGRDFQQAWHDQYNEGQKLINEKLKEFNTWGQERQSYQQYQQAIQPLIPQWQQRGINPAVGLTQLASYAQSLQADPTSTILKLAKDYGVNLEETLQEQPYVDPTVRTLQEKIDQLMSQQQQTQQQWQQQQQNAQLSQVYGAIDSFKDAKNENGELLNPHFEALHDDMATLINMGKAKSLEDAYKQAMRYNDDIQKQLKADELARKQADVKKAKTASQRTSSKTTETPARVMSLREQLSANFEAG